MAPNTLRTTLAPSATSREQQENTGGFEQEVLDTEQESPWSAYTEYSSPGELTEFNCCFGASL